MTRDEARHILALYRPWSADADDPDFAEALALTGEDAELRQWFEQHCATQMAIRARFKQVAIPAGLKEQIISERKAAVAAARWRRPTLAAAVAALLLLLVGGGVWLVHHQREAEELSFANYRSRMVRTALRLYGMDMETNNVTAIRAYLAEHHAPTNYVLPKPLTETTATGCGVLSWQGNPVSMVCFHSGKPLPAGEKTDLFLFVMDRSAAADAPATNAPQWVQVNRMITASWRDGDVVYVLATPGDESLLKKFL